MFHLRNGTGQGRLCESVPGGAVVYVTWRHWHQPRCRCQGKHRFGSKYRNNVWLRLCQKHVSRAQTKSIGSSVRWRSKAKSAIRTFCAWWHTGRIRTSTAWRLSFASKKHCSAMFGNSRTRLVMFKFYDCTLTLFRSCPRRKQST